MWTLPRIQIRRGNAGLGEPLTVDVEKPWYGNYGLYNHFHAKAKGRTIRYAFIRFKMYLQKITTDSSPILCLECPNITSPECMEDRRQFPQMEYFHNQQVLSKIAKTTLFLEDGGWLEQNNFILNQNIILYRHGQTRNPMFYEPRGPDSYISLVGQQSNPRKTT